MQVHGYTIVHTIRYTGSSYTGVAVAYPDTSSRGFHSIKIVRAKCSHKSFQSHAPLITTAHAMALDLTVKTHFYSL